MSVVSVVSVLISGASLGEGVGQCGRTPDIAGVLTVTHHNMHSTQYSYCTVVSAIMGEMRDYYIRNQDHSSAGVAAF